MKNEEDLKIFKSTKTGRGPLTNNWMKVSRQNKTSVMCAYKLCKVYQIINSITKFIKKT